MSTMRSHLLTASPCRRADLRPITSSGGVAWHLLCGLIVLTSVHAIITITAEDPNQNEETSHWSADVPGFYHRLYFSEGESEVRAHLRQVTVIENALQARGTVSRRLSDGHQLLSLFYLDSKLVSCRIETDPVEVAEFYRTIMDDFNCAEHKMASQTVENRADESGPASSRTPSSISDDDDLINLDIRNLRSGEVDSQSPNLRGILGQNREGQTNQAKSTEVFFREGDVNAEDSSVAESQSLEDPSYSSEEPPWCSIEDRLKRQIWNETFVLLDQKSDPKQLIKEVMEVLHFRSHRRACRRLQRQLRRAAAAPQETFQDATADEDMKAFEQTVDNELFSVEDGPLSLSRRKNFNVLRKRRKRIRRSLFSSIMPGTKWCGSGNHATGTNELGASASTDSCCREHDQCPYTLVAFERRWGLRNKSLFTMSHCKCDERFRSCLKMARTSQSRFVGRLFFDLLSKQCFVFKKVRRCARLSWDGSRCIRKRWAKKAVVRDGMNYY